MTHGEPGTASGWGTDEGGGVGLYDEFKYARVTDCCAIFYGCGIVEGAGLECGVGRAVGDYSVSMCDGRGTTSFGAGWKDATGCG